MAASHPKGIEQEVRYEYRTPGSVAGLSGNWLSYVDGTMQFAFDGSKK
jgi:hypothetical protein